MRVASSTLSMSSAYSATQSFSSQTSLNLNIPTNSPTPTLASKTISDAVSLSAAGTAAASSNTPQQTMPPLINLIKSILEKVLGVHFSLVDGKLLQDAVDGSQSSPSTSNTGQTAPGLSGSFQSSMTYQETESLAFSAAGTVTTSSGQQFQFSLDVQMQRSFQMSSSQSLSFGNQAAATDPLMITLGGDAGSLSNASVQFDLKNNGAMVKLPFASSGGWLALDSNHNGKIDNGSELFGPQSGNGFSDLATLDSNQDGVIDEADPAFAQLKLWTGVTGDGKDQLKTLQQVNIGAILLPSVSSPFSIKDPNNHAVAALSRSGIYLTEDGRAGQISQIDIMS
jgi:hypothetical protein